MNELTAFFLTPLMGKTLWMWLVFLAIVIFLLVLDLGVLHRKDRVIGMRESLLMYGGYFAIGLLYGLWIWYELGSDSALDFYNGFIIEQSLSMDNVFVMAVILGFFGIPAHLQHRVLFWGILGVILLRAVMIGLGAALIQNYEWVLYIFGVFLLFTGAKLLFRGDGHADESSASARNRIVLFIRRHFNVTDEIHGHHFFVRIPDKTGKLALHATPLFLALALIEFSDLVFAVDSVPAVFAITQDPYIVYTSNIFAILGLRSLYFALAALMHRFIYLQYALGAVLIFIGAKILLHLWDIKIPSPISLAVTFTLLAAGVLISLLRTQRKK